MDGHPSDSQPLFQGISQHLPAGGLIAIVWSSVGLAGAFIIARTRIRITRVERLGFEDYWLYFAYLILVVNAVLQTLQTRHLYYLDRANAGLEPLGATFLWHGNQYVKYEFCIIGLFWTVLWSVKASWLALYWGLFKGLQLYQRWWKGVAAFSFGTYAGCWIASSLNCHPASAYFRFGQCEKASDLKGSIISVTYSTAADTLTDLMIMSLPLNMLYKAHLAFRQKVGLAAVFSLVTVIICVAIIRAVEISRRTHQDGVLLALWGIIESTVSVIVGCLPALKSLLRDRKMSTRRNTPAYVNDYSHFMFRGGQTPLSSEENSSARGRWTNMAPLTKGDSQVEPLPTDDKGFEDLVTKGGIGDMRLYLNISTQRSDTIGQGDMV